LLVLQIKIENFRGIKNADLTFGGHTLLVSGNNVGKSTVCDALDFVLGPDPKSRNQPGADVRGSLKLPKWKAAAPQPADVENIAINERLSANPAVVDSSAAGPVSYGLLSLAVESAELPLTKPARNSTRPEALGQYSTLRPVCSGCCWLCLQHRSGLEMRIRWEISRE